MPLVQDQSLNLLTTNYHCTMDAPGNYSNSSNYSNKSQYKSQPTYPLHERHEFPRDSLERLLCHHTTEERTQWREATLTGVRQVLHCDLIQIINLQKDK